MIRVRFHKSSVPTKFPIVFTRDWFQKSSLCVPVYTRLVSDQNNPGGGINMGLENVLKINIWEVGTNGGGGK